jgi:hypothetical protein
MLFEETEGSKSRRRRRYLRGEPGGEENGKRKRTKNNKNTKDEV